MKRPGLTERQRLAKYPPWLCLAMTVERREPETKWKRQERRTKLKRLQRKGIATPRKLWRHRYRRISRAEIESRSGLSKRKINRISSSLTWDKIPIGEGLRFREACKIDLCHLERLGGHLVKMLKSTRPFGHLDPKQYQKFVVQLRKFKQSQSTQKQP